MCIGIGVLHYFGKKRLISTLTCGKSRPEKLQSWLKSCTPGMLLSESQLGASMSALMI